MADKAGYKFLDSFIVTSKKPDEGASEFKLYKVDDRSHAIVASKLKRDESLDGQLKPVNERVIAYGTEEAMKKFFTEIKHDIVIKQDDRRLEQLHNLAPINLKKGEVINVEVISKRPTVGNITDVVVKGDKTWILRVPSKQALDWKPGEKISLYQTLQGLRIETEMQKKLSQNNLKI